MVWTVYVARAWSFVFTYVAIGVLCWERGAGVATWLFLALTFLVYPHLAYLNARSSPNPRATEYYHLLFDALVFGVWAAQLGYPLWIVYPLLAGAVLNNLVIRGPSGLLPSIGLFALGAILWGPCGDSNSIQRRARSSRRWGRSVHSLTFAPSAQ